MFLHRVHFLHFAIMVVNKDVVISDTCKNQPKRLDSDNTINLSSLIVNLESHTLLSVVVSLRLFVFLLLQGYIPSLYTVMVLVFHLHCLSHSSRPVPDRNLLSGM
jgi:hypothetical protein